MSLPSFVEAKHSLVVGDSNVEATKIPCLIKGIAAGLWIDLEDSWATAAGSEPSVTYKRDWACLGGTGRDFSVGCPFAATALGGYRGRCVDDTLDEAAPLMKTCLRWASRPAGTRSQVNERKSTVAMSQRPIPLLTD